MSHIAKLPVLVGIIGVDSSVDWATLAIESLRLSSLAIHVFRVSAAFTSIRINAKEIIIKRIS